MLNPVKVKTKDHSTAKNTSIKRAKEIEAKLDAINKSQAVIEFSPDGTILDANDNFLGAMGYRREEVRGRHHRMFVDPAYAESREYIEFWQRLRRGEFQRAEYQRFGRDGKEVWIQASYNPIFDNAGNPYKVIKLAIDVTDDKMRNADFEGQINAVNKTQAVIHFNLDGTIIEANENFLEAMGYHRDEITGRHHRMFVDPNLANSREYEEFWERLRRGEAQTSEYKRFGKDGREVWIMASYNPIFDMNGRPFKVVKYASDVTEQKMRNADFCGQIEAVNKSQAVIHFNMDGTIIEANSNFLNAVGYHLEEIKGKHHRIFVEPSYAESRDYVEFWNSLRRGEYQQAEYKRFGKGGKEVWIMASYNPVFDMEGRPFKVVKYASDITGQMGARLHAASAIQQTLSNVQTVAASAEELNASVEEISRNMSLSMTAVNDMNARINEADQATQQLQHAADAMDNVVQLIQKIANQINLLALNATIESARAGEAGKGFAVVASEVKNLANQTTNATNDISREIQAMQSVSHEVANALGTINAAIGSVREFVGSVAGAIEEQSVVTKEISSNMQMASRSVQDISDSIKEMVG